MDDGGGITLNISSAKTTPARKKPQVSINALIQNYLAIVRSSTQGVLSVLTQGRQCATWVYIVINLFPSKYSGYVGYQNIQGMWDICCLNTPI